ncbi:MAG: hypothetical protein HXS47_06260 [Theionarchaea archaeon]|nr:hypothetical protein [Theionarchaea archaeon]
MKKLIAVLVILGLILPTACVADEMSDAQDAINEAESLLEAMNSMGFWFGPSAALKMEAENHLQMAKEAFEAGNYSEALQHALMALQYGHGAMGLRGWSMLPGPQYPPGQTDLLQN